MSRTPSLYHLWIWNPHLQYTYEAKIKKKYKKEM
jgi:hypothetical protein